MCAFTQVCICSVGECVCMSLYTYVMTLIVVLNYIKYICVYFKDHLLKTFPILYMHTYVYTYVFSYTYTITASNILYSAKI